MKGTGRVRHTAPEGGRREPWPILGSNDQFLRRKWTVDAGARSAACADTGQPIHAWWRGLTAPVLVDQLDCSVRRTNPGGHAASDTPEAHPLAKKRLGGGRPSATEGLALGPGKATLFQGYAHRGPLHLR